MESPLPSMTMFCTFIAALPSWIYSSRMGQWFNKWAILLQVRQLLPAAPGQGQSCLWEFVKLAGWCEKPWGMEWEVDWDADMTIWRFCPIMVITFRTSNISLFMGGTEGFLDEVKGLDILYWWSKPSKICLAPSLHIWPQMLLLWCKVSFHLRGKTKSCPVIHSGWMLFL